jgi:predicted DNA-binding transcriptional regulator AlpA
MQKIAINENELAQRWGISPKTLQRWRSEGRGPRYLKLSKRVAYPVDEILKFEKRALYESTSERSCHVAVSPDTKLVTAKEVATATNLPMYLLTHPKLREALGLPFVYIGKSVRFDPDEVMAWARRCSKEMEDHGIETPADPKEERQSLLQAIAKLQA